MASFHHRVKSGKKGTAADHAAYLARRGKYRGRDDLVNTGYGNMPSWAEDSPSNFWRAADKYERANGAAYREHEIALPSELTRCQQLQLVTKLVADLAGKKPYQYAIHVPVSALQAVENAHVHLMFSDRMPDGLERPPEQIFRRYNPKQPALGGAKKDSGGKRPIALRLDLIETRRRCADLQNEALAMHGHAARVDHRTLKQRNVDRVPERHQGPGRVSRMTEEEKAAYVAARRIGGG
jgi:hypothetical protein